MFCLYTVTTVFVKLNAKDLRFDPIAQNKQSANREANMAKVIRWQGDGTFDQEVVGESHYQEDLRRLAGGERRQQTTARLVCESNNQHDALAVRVEIGGKTIGHLSRNDARQFRVLLKAGRSEGAIVELPAVIVTGRDGVCGVYLSVTETSARSTMRFDKPSFVRRHYTLLWVIAVIFLVSIGGSPIGLVLAIGLIYYRLKRW